MLRNRHSLAAAHARPEVRWSTAAQKHNYSLSAAHQTRCEMGPQMKISTITHHLHVTHKKESISISYLLKYSVY